MAVVSFCHWCESLQQEHAECRLVRHYEFRKLPAFETMLSELPGLSPQSELPQASETHGQSLCIP